MLFSCQIITVCWRYFERWFLWTMLFYLRFAHRDSKRSRPWRLTWQTPLPVLPGAARCRQQLQVYLDKQTSYCWLWMLSWVLRDFKIRFIANHPHVFGNLQNRNFSEKFCLSFWASGELTVTAGCRSAKIKRTVSAVRHYFSIHRFQLRAIFCFKYNVVRSYKCSYFALLPSRRVFFGNRRWWCFCIRGQRSDLSCTSIVSGFHQESGNFFFKTFSPRTFDSATWLGHR